MPISVVHTTIANTLSVTIPATTAGNCLVVCVCSENNTGQATVSGITLGGSAGNFAQLTDANGNDGAGNFADAIQWADPNCAGGQTAVVISGTNLNVSSGAGGVFIFEISGLATSAILDKSSTAPNGTNSSASWSSGGAGPTTQASEIWIGCAVTFNTISGPGAPWTTSTDPGGFSCAGQQIVSATGTATFSGTQSGAATWAASVVTLKAPGAVTPAPFTAPHSPLRGPRSARPGRTSRGRGPAPAPAPFTAPRRPLRGPVPGRPGRTSAGRGQVVIVPPPTPAPFFPPHSPARGPRSARSGRILRPITGIVTPVTPAISGVPVIPSDILKPWRKHGWPRTPLAFADYPEPAGNDALVHTAAMSTAGSASGQARGAALRPPGRAVQAGAAAAALATAATRRAARAVDTGRALQDPAVAESVFYWQQKRKRKGST